MIVNRGGIQYSDMIVNRGGIQYSDMIVNRGGIQYNEPRNSETATRKRTSNKNKHNR